MPSPRTRWIGLVVVSLAVALIIVDSTIVTVAVPSIVEELGLSSTEVQWVQESYTLVFASLLLVFGTLADRIGRRRMLLLGITIFALSSVVAALAGSGGALIAARVVQGVGGAMLLPTTLSIINAGFRGKDRAIAFAVWGSTIGGMAAVGPLLGGWLTTFFSWRWAFGINVPLGIIIIVGALLFSLLVSQLGTQHRESETRNPRCRKTGPDGNTLIRDNKQGNHPVSSSQVPELGLFPGTLLTGKRILDPMDHHSLFVLLNEALTLIRKDQRSQSRSRAHDQPMRMLRVRGAVLLDDIRNDSGTRSVNAPSRSEVIRMHQRRVGLLSEMPEQAPLHNRFGDASNREVTQPYEPRLSYSRVSRYCCETSCAP